MYQAFFFFPLASSALDKKKKKTPDRRLEASCYVFPYSFSLWSGCVFENGESVVSVQTDVIFAVFVAKVVKNKKAN